MSTLSPELEQRIRAVSEALAETAIGHPRHIQEAICALVEQAQAEAVERIVGRRLKPEELKDATLYRKRTGIEADNHHNALTCPYCNPGGLVLIDPKVFREALEQARAEERERLNRTLDGMAAEWDDSAAWENNNGNPQYASGLWQAVNDMVNYLKQARADKQASKSPGGQ